MNKPNTEHTPKSTTILLVISGINVRYKMCVCMCACVCVHACVCACVCVRVCVCVWDTYWFVGQQIA